MTQIYAVLIIFEMDYSILSCSVCTYLSSRFSYPFGRAVTLSLVTFEGQWLVHLSSKKVTVSKNMLLTKLNNFSFSIECLLFFMPAY